MPTFESIHLELREFFAKLDFEQVRTIALSMSTTDRKPELDATLKETAAAIPMLKQVTANLNQRQAEGDTDNARALQGQLILLMAIYRLAEDQGYQWIPPNPNSGTTPPPLPTTN